MPIPSKPNIVTIGIVAHEAAHSSQFGRLGDEYSYFGKLHTPESRAERLKRRGNLQFEKELLNDPNDPQSGLDGNKIRWSRGDLRE
jgi:hypothetical protein